MSDPTPRSMAIFFEVFEALPRQGPGSRACTEKALRLCADLPDAPDILDLGCGAGAQTIDLAALTSGSIVAMDVHVPLISRLRTKVSQLGLQSRVRATEADMASPDFDPGSFDLIWSEGALYNIGIGAALDTYHDILRPAGYMAFTDAVWLKSNPPDEVSRMFADYPAMGDTEKVISAIGRHRFSLVGHFQVPDEAWWDDFYTPMEQRIAQLRQQYAEDTEALKILSDIALEPELHRQFGKFYGYEFFVARRE